MSSFDTMFDLMSLNNKCSRETNRNNKTIKKLQESRKPVKEGRWNKTLDNAIAKKLRNAIDEENLRDVLDAIKDGYYWIAQQDDYSYDETDVESDIEDFDYIDDNEEAVNYELDKFYDVCDALRIWVPTYFEEACGKKKVSKKDKKDKVVTEDTHGVNTDNIKTYPYKVKEWYHKEYPDDDIWEEIDSDITFFDVYSTLRGKHDVYDVLGVGDSVVRERVFDKLSEIGKVDYDVIYNMWLGESKKSSKAAKKLSEKVDQEFFDEVRKFFIVEERNGDIDTTPIVTKDLMDVINTALYRWRYGHSSSERRQCNSYYVCSMIDREDGNGDWYSDFDTMKDYVDIIELDKWLSKNRGKSKEEYPDDYYDEEKDIELYLKEHR